LAAQLLALMVFSVVAADSGLVQVVPMRAATLNQ
jgi:hypothetical protein